MPSLTAFHHVALTVADLEASIAWYEEVLGFEVLFREGELGDDRVACVLAVPGGGPMLGLVSFAGTAETIFDPHRRGLDHVAFTVGSLEELEAGVVRLDEHGIEHSGPIEVPPGAIVNFRDPDGIALALFWDRR